MPFTPQTLRDYANANVIDNTVGAISPKDVRDGFLVTADVFDELNADIAAISTGLRVAESWSAASGSFPSGATTGTYYIVSTAGTTGGQTFAVGDWLIPLVNTPSTSVFAGNWTRANYSQIVPPGVPKLRVTSLTVLLANTSLGSTIPVSNGDEVEAGGVVYTVVSSGQTITTAGGVKLKMTRFRVPFPSLTDLEADANAWPENTEIEVSSVGQFAVKDTTAYPNLNTALFASNLTGWTTMLGSATWISSGVAEVEATGGSFPGRIARQITGLTAGSTYEFEAPVISVSGGASHARVYISSASIAGPAYVQTSGVPGDSAVGQFVAPGTSVWVLLDTATSTSGAKVRFGPVEVRLIAQPDFLGTESTTNAVGSPMVARVGRDGVIYPAQMGAKPGASFDVTTKLQTAVDELNQKPNGGTIFIPPNDYYLSSLRIMPNVNIVGAGTQTLAEGAMKGGSKLRQIGGVAAPLIYNEPDTCGGYLRSPAVASNEGDQFYYNSTISGVVMDARSTANLGTQNDAFRLSRAWNVRLRDTVALAGKGAFAWRLIDCNVLWAEGNTTMGPSFAWVLADSIITNNQMGGLQDNSAVNYFWPVLWLAGDTSWKNVISNNIPFNNAGNIGGPTWTFTFVGTLLTLSSSHEFQDGDPVCLETSGTFPTGTDGVTTYFIKRVSSTTVRLATSIKDVVAGTFVSLSGGSGTHTLRGGANCVLFLQKAKLNILTGNRYDQGYGSGIIARGATLNSMNGGTVLENGLGSGGTVPGISLEQGSNDNALEGVVLSGNATQTVGVAEDATCSGNMVNVIAKNHTSGNLNLLGTRPASFQSSFFGSDRFESLSGSPVIGTIGGGRRNAWLLDAASEEIVGTEFIMPDGWTKLKVSIYWVNAGAGSGNVVFAYNFGQFAAGVTLNAADSLGSLNRTFTAAAQDVLSISVFSSDIITVSPGVTSFLRVKRTAADAADTLGNDIGIIGVLIERAD